MKKIDIKKLDKFEDVSDKEVKKPKPRKERKKGTRWLT